MVEVEDIVNINACCYFVSLKKGAITVLVVHILYHLDAFLTAMSVIDSDATFSPSAQFGNYVVSFLLVEAKFKIVYALLSVTQVAVNGLGIYGVTMDKGNFLLIAVVVSGCFLAYDLITVACFAAFRYHLPYGTMILVSHSNSFFKSVLHSVTVQLQISGLVLDLVLNITSLLNEVSLPWFLFVNIILLVLMFHFFTVIYSYYTEIDGTGW